MQSMVQPLQPEHRFTVRKLLERYPRLRCVIDLTDTYRYYNPKELTDAGVRYEKLKIRGQQIPTEDKVRQFFLLIEELTATCAEDEIVGVHCTHGINRTGYLICRYFVQRLNWDVEDSLAAFSQARGHSIERKNYVDALRQAANDNVRANEIELPNQQEERPIGNLTRFSLSTNSQRLLPPVPIPAPIPATITTASLSPVPLRSNLHPVFTNATTDFLDRMPRPERRRRTFWTDRSPKRVAHLPAATIPSSHASYSRMSPPRHHHRSRFHHSLLSNRFARFKEQDFTVDTPEENMIVLNGRNIDRFCSQKK